MQRMDSGASERRIKATPKRKATLPLLCLVVLFLIYMLEKIHVIYSDELIMRILNLVEWPIYLLAFAYSMVKIRYSRKELFMIFGVCGILAISFLVSGYAELLKGALLIVVLKNEDYVQIQKTMLRILLLTIMLTLFLYVTGLSNAGIQRRGKSSLGYFQANAVGFVLMMMTFLVLTSNDRITWKLRVELLAVNSLGFILTDGRTGFIVACAAIFLINKPFMRFMRKHRFVLVILMGIPILCCTLTIVSALLYPKSLQMQMLDKLVTGRIWLNYYNISHHSIQLFGQNVTLWNMTDSFYNPVTKAWSTYMTVDNMYVTMLLQMGVLSTAIVFIAYGRLNKKLFACGEYRSAIILCLLCIYALMENAVMSIYVCYPFMMLMHRKDSRQLR